MSPQSKPKSRTRNCILSCLGAILVFGCLLVGLAGGGYSLYRNGVITRKSVQDALGFGTGEIMTTNITENVLRIELTRLDTQDGEPSNFNTIRAEPLDRAGIGGIPPGRYLLEITGVPVEATCTLQIESGDVYQLVNVPEGTAITREGYEPVSAGELDLATTSLCNQ